MNKFVGVKFYLLITSLIIATLSTLPIEAAIRQQPSQLQRKTDNQFLALSWVDIWNLLRVRRTPKGGRGAICAILPQELVNSSTSQKRTDEIWTDKPVFLWRGVGVIQIDIFERGKDEVFATLKVKEGLTKIKYNDKPLQPGQSYTWQITAQNRGLPIKDTGSNFTLMDSQKRASTTDELTKLEATLKKKGDSVEKIALGKADYFAKKEMWTDVLEQLYSVKNPSPQLVDTIKKIEGYNFCNSEQAAVSTLP
ncbi:DUF928 domain-containing protein [Nostoc sp. CHAB 5836]|uniref:DUF928 domain-containing protein n=1 Tax=Nostoc sp. CHAB 5836 TaxID=2780404 RepID=UPI001E550A35|nr:DUF928 domain-containing protein [Nostoc sp. CHAB 5836]MCC5618021.1 DUF928 domain-containing protein [Nostoc sp. CHAB 5836]